MLDIFRDPKQEKIFCRHSHSRELRKLISLVKCGLVIESGTVMTVNGRRIVMCGNPGTKDFAFGIEGSALAVAATADAVDEAFDRICPETTPVNHHSFRVIVPSGSVGRGFLYRRSIYNETRERKRELAGSEDRAAAKLLAVIRKALK